MTARTICRCSLVSSPINSRQSFATEQMANASLSWRAGACLDHRSTAASRSQTKERQQPALARMVGQEPPPCRPRNLVLRIRRHQAAQGAHWFALSEDRPLFASMRRPAPQSATAGIRRHRTLRFDYRCSDDSTAFEIAMRRHDVVECISRLGPTSRVPSRMASNRSAALVSSCCRLAVYMCRPGQVTCNAFGARRNGSNAGGLPDA
jgi:hypothetical protein